MTIFLKKTFHTTTVFSFFSFFSFVFLFFCFSIFSVHAQNTKSDSATLALVNLRLVGDDSQMRMIAVFKGRPSYELRFLDNPKRLVVNLPTVDFSAQVTPPVLMGMALDLRYGLTGQNESRIVLTLNQAFLVEKNYTQELEGGLWQLVVDLSVDNQDNFDKIVQKQKLESVNKTKTSGPSVPLLFRVVIDAGHGGVDSGAKGVSGVLEKKVTLDFARTLRHELEKKPEYQVFLTRDSDVFLRLKERVQKARTFNADLFISIHADTINSKSLRGATVYTLSDKASDAVARALAERENMSDLLDGLPADDVPEITDILIELTRRETHIFSLKFADSLVEHLAQNNIRLINMPHRYAGFQVLKAPDIPSVLIEIGYLSNKSDESLMTTAAWQVKMATAIAASVEEFAKYRKGQFNVTRELNLPREFQSIE